MNTTIKLFAVCLFGASLSLTSEASQRLVNSDIIQEKVEQHRKKLDNMIKVKTQLAKNCSNTSSEGDSIFNHSHSRPSLDTRLEVNRRKLADRRKSRELRMKRYEELKSQASK